MCCQQHMKEGFVCQSWHEGHLFTDSVLGQCHGDRTPHSRPSCCALMTAHHTHWGKVWAHKLQWKQKQCLHDFDPVRESVCRHWHSYCSLIQISYKSYTDRIHHFCMVPIMQSKCFPKLDKTMLPASTRSKYGSKQQIFRMLLFLPPRVAEWKGKTTYPLLSTQLTYTNIFLVKQKTEMMLWDSRARLLLRCVCNGWLSSELCAK